MEESQTRPRLQEAKLAAAFVRVFGTLYGFGGAVWNDHDAMRMFARKIAVSLQYGTRYAQPVGPVYYTCKRAERWCRCRAATIGVSRRRREHRIPPG